MKKIYLSENTITKEHLESLSGWLSTNPRLTKGKLTEEFEQKFSDHLGVKYSVFVNSGSSALLLMLSALVQSGKLNVGDTICVPRVSWSTDASSTYYAGLNIKFIDCNLEDLSISIEDLRRAHQEEPIKALLFVEVLGLVPNMERVVNFCKTNDIIILEDTCESLGSRYDGRMLGTFGYASVFSTYFGHHFSTIEGGFVCTNDREFYNILKSMRSHGWDRDLDEDIRVDLRCKYRIDPFKAKYTFYYPSFNFRPTDLQAFIGIQQIEDLDNIYESRERNYNRFVKNLSPHLSWIPNSHGFTSSFSYPIIAKNKTQRNFIIEELDKENIENRPLICGDMMCQPFVKFRVSPSYEESNSYHVENFGLYVPNHPGLNESDIDRICGAILRGVRNE